MPVSMPMNMAHQDQGETPGSTGTGTPARPADGDRRPPRAVGTRDAARVGTLPSGPIGWQVLLLALPMLGEQLGIYTVGLVDTWLAGHVSKEATAAVGAGSYMGWFFTLSFSLIGIGAAALVSRSYGARDVPTADRALHQAVTLALGLGLLVSAAGFAAAPVFAGQLTQTAAARGLCLTFLRIDALGYLFASVTMIGGAVLRGAGDTRTPMAVTIAVNVVNVAVAVSLVQGWFGPPLGVVGIALGTLTARFAGGILMLGVLARGRRGLRLTRRGLRPDLGLQWRMLRIGLPSAGESGLMWIGHLTFVTIIARCAAGDASTTNLAAHMIAMRAEGVGYLPAMAWMTAAATLVGQYLGAGRPADARRAGHVAALQGAALATLVGAAFFTLAGPIYRLLSDDAGVRAVGAPAFRFIGFAQPFLSMGIIYMGALRGAGDTRWPMVFTGVCSVGVRVPGAWLGAIVLEGGLLGAWCGMWADNVLRFVLAATRFARGAWMRARV